jgi:hypothetical protein
MLNQHDFEGTMHERNIIGVTASVLSPFIEGVAGDAGKIKGYGMD